ncbi:MAG TPA: hypothetical protein VGJ92_04205 [Methanocella sp.]|jgi:hypothetical protein
MQEKGLNRDLAEEETRALGVAERALLRETGRKPIDFVSIEPAEWSDASLGWPRPGMSSAQVITEGFRITARSAGKLFECRVAGDNVRCQIIKGG